ncbi:MAG: hypothetical protein QXW98_07110 [Candidatus Caldarchaeum sp.]
MTRAWAYVKRAFTRVREHKHVHFKVRSALKYVEEIHLNIGEVLVIEGGAEERAKATDQIRRVLERHGIRYLFVDAIEPKSNWLKDYKLPIPSQNHDDRINNIIRFEAGTKRGDSFYLIIQNADKISDAKVNTVLKLIEASRSTVMLTTNVDEINKRVIAMQKPRLISLGTARNTYDVTYPIIALLMIIVILAGHSEAVFLAAAARYLFVGMRRWKEA